MVNLTSIRVVFGTRVYQFGIWIGVGMESYSFILDLAIILLTTKVLGLVTKKFKMPQVVGALLAGLLFGPACLNIIQETSFIQSGAEIGVIVLMFCAGLETDVKELKKSGKASLVIAIIGVVVPLAGGYLITKLFNDPTKNAVFACPRSCLVISI